MATTSLTDVTTISAVTPVVPFVFDGSYKGDDLTQKAAKVLGLDTINGWEVIDHDEHLALVHYSKDGNMAKHGNLRGVLVDTEVEAVIADSFGYTPTAILPELTVKDNNLDIVDNEGVTHKFNLGEDELYIKKVFEGCVIRLVWHKSKLYRLTHRKIHPLKSRWGASKYFLTIFDEAGGPKAEDLFDITKPYSTTSYDFLVVDQQLLVGTRQIVNKPYVVYLTKRELDIKRPAEETAVGQFKSAMKPEITGVVNGSFIHDPQSMTVPDANLFLKYGYYDEFDADDIRQQTGEAVIIYSVKNGEIKDIVKVHSPSYEYRTVIRGNNSNIEHQFYCLLPLVYPDIDTKERWDYVMSKLIPFPLYDEESIKDLYAQSKVILTIPKGEQTKEELMAEYATRDARVHLLWMNFVLSLPVHAQEQALNILDNYKNNLVKVSEWICNLESTQKDIMATEFSARVKNIITSSRRLAHERLDEGNNYSAKGSYMKIPTLIKSTIRNLLNKENGTSLYSLVREMKKLAKEEAEAEAQALEVKETVEITIPMGIEAVVGERRKFEEEVVEVKDAIAITIPIAIESAVGK